MRHARIVGGVLGVVAVSAAVSGFRPPAEGAAADPAAALADTERARTVAYRGVRVPVPAGWAVHDLAREPGRCVRFDRNAVYLGTPAADADCPSRVVGGATALHVEPLGPAGQRRAGVVRADRLAGQDVPATPDHALRLPVPEAGVTLTGAYGADPAELERIVRATRLSAGWPAEPAPPAPAPVPEETPPPAAPEPRDTEQRAWATGKGFDTCAAPSLAAMRAWRKAYQISNIYIGGAARGCAQKNLNAAYVKQVRAMGYRLIPTYVGLQAPCSKYKARFSAANAAAQGRAAADDAVAKAKGLGIPAGQPVYFDLEAYNSNNASCRNAALTFVGAYSARMKALDYVPGLYSSGSSGIRDVGRATGITKPTAVWYAHWDRKTAIYDSPYLESSWWPPHRRIKQYRGGHKETHGGVTINVDNNAVDAHVY
ncbi:glycoside hydrolase domain-containing protein [Actinomadura flavalba]|uniref:glycoside hydrolase domain-containing protein n=1 Tax=Actinomadura flavalba TaxID=1120938 RepID=UPI00039FFE2A|nr:glycoside hydrolase domain-containing protein [Actinomadura flavalba]